MRRPVHPVRSLFLVLAGLGTFFLSACSSSDEDFAEAPTAAPPVETVQAKRGALPLVERLSGTLRAANQVVLHPEITGRVAQVFVDDGDTVRAGQALVRIADDQVREQVRQSEAGHRIAAARLRQAEARLAETEAQTRRLRSLKDRALVSELEYETLAAQRESAAADVELAEAELEQAAANLAERKDLLARAVVRAPVDGVVGDRRAEVGMQVGPSTSLFTIGDLSDLRVHVNLTDSMVGYIEVGQQARLVLDDLEENADPLTGRVARISPFLNEVTRSTEAEISIDASDTRLRPGMFLPVDILYGESQQATLVPTSALFTDPNTGREGVYVITAGTFDADAVLAGPDALSEPMPVQFRTFNIIARGAHEVAIDKLNSGDWIVTLGQDLLASDGRTRARARPVSWDHVMELQGLNREDLLNEVLEATGRDS